MAWALFDGEKKVSKSHTHKEAVYIEAMEKGFVLLSKGNRWLKDGSSIREIDLNDYLETKEPKIGDPTFSVSGDMGIIKQMEGGLCTIEITHKENTNDMLWDESVNAWRYQ